MAKYNFAAIYKCFDNRDFITDSLKQSLQNNQLLTSKYITILRFCRRNKDKPSLIAAIQSARYRGGTTATYDGLRYARYYHFASYHGGRANATKLVIVMTDGRSNDVSRTITEAVSLKVIIYYKINHS